MSSAQRFLVPLNTMCSTKCEMPFHCGSSSRDPVLIQIPIETERMCCISSVMTVSPFGSTSRRMLRIFLYHESCLLLHNAADSGECAVNRFVIIYLSESADRRPPHRWVVLYN